MVVSNIVRINSLLKWSKILFAYVHSIVSLFLYNFTIQVFRYNKIKLAWLNSSGLFWENTWQSLRLEMYILRCFYYVLNKKSIVKVGYFIASRYAISTRWCTYIEGVQYNHLERARCIYFSLKKTILCTVFYVKTKGWLLNIILYVWKDKTYNHHIWRNAIRITNLIWFLQNWNTNIFSCSSWENGTITKPTAYVVIRRIIILQDQ